MGSLAAAMAGHAARAQDVSASPTAGTQFDRGRTVAVTQRAQPGYEETGTRAGDFTIYPRLRASVAYDDNARARAARNGDFAASLEPSVRVLSEWPRHQLGFAATALLTRFAKLESENAETFAVHGQGRYDVGDELKVFGQVGYRRDVERRSAPGALRNSLRPTTYNTASASAQVTWQGNRLRLVATGNAARIDYGDVTTVEGTVFNSRELDRDRYQGGLRADYAVTPNLAVLVTGTVTKIDYHRPAAAITPDRSARRAELLAGLSFEFTDLLRGEAAVGYINQNFRNPGLRDFSGFGGRVELDYFPSRLTTVHFDTSRTLQDAGNPLAPTYRRTRIGLRVDHELFRHVVVSAFADYESNRFQLPARRERRPHGGLSGQYLVDRHLTLFARYDHLRVTTRPSAFGRRFTDNVISVGVLFKP
jgi:hypothetical protein